MADAIGTEVVHIISIGCCTGGATEGLFVQGGEREVVSFCLYRGTIERVLEDWLEGWIGGPVLGLER